MEEVTDPYFTGREKPPLEAGFHLPSKEFKKADLYLKDFDLRNVTELTPIKDQGQCGSCVYFAVTAMFEDELRLRGLKTDILSPQWLMSCAAREWMCEGSFFEKVAQGLVAKGGQALESEYRYTASNAACKAGNFKLYGKIDGYKIIDNSHLSIIGAVNQKHPVGTTIGAGGVMMNYRSGGVMPASSCQNIGTNHQMEIVGYDCGTSVDSSGKYCAFDSKGMLAKNSGAYWIIRNSWNTSYGDKGYLYISMMNTSGGRCNNVTEEVGILDTGVEPPPPIPPGPVGKDFQIDSDVALVKGTVKADYVKYYENIVKVFTEFLGKFKE
jgi:cathepsin L